MFRLPRFIVIAALSTLFWTMAAIPASDVTVALASVTSAVRFDAYVKQPGIDAIHYTFGITLNDESDEIRAESVADLRFVQAGSPACFSTSRQSRLRGQGWLWSPSRWTGVPSRSSTKTIISH